MRIVFFGTGRFGIPSLDRLLKDESHEIVAIVTGPDRKSGRGWQVRPTPVKAYMGLVTAEIPILQPEKLNEIDFLGRLRKTDADLFVVIDYGQFLSAEILGMPRKYCINLHPSLLPKYRGAAPVNRAILSGDTVTGNTVVKMNERMDAGSMLMREEVPIGGEESAPHLFERLSQSGASLMQKAVDAIVKGGEKLTEQDEAAATYAPKLKKEEGRIDWSAPAGEIVRRVRGMQPWPGAYTALDGKVLKIFKAKIIENAGEGASPGAVICEADFVVRAGDGAVRLEDVQLEGKKMISAVDFLRGYPLKKGVVLG